jgi:tetratricopeptide (TPR) repeat protein
MDKSPVQRKLAVKITLDDDIRRVSVDPSTLTYEVLRATVKRLFKTLSDEETDALTIRYQDDESDWITISSDEELVEAVSLLKNVSSPVLRLSLTRAKQAGGCGRWGGFKPWWCQRQAGQGWGQGGCHGGKRWARGRFFGLQNQGLKLLQAGDYKAARALFEEQLSIFNHHTPIYNIACCEALSGNSKEALAYLQKAVNAGFTDVAHIEKDSDLDSLRDLDEYKTIIANLKANASSSSSSSSSACPSTPGQAGGCGGGWKRWCGGRFRYFQLHQQAIRLMESGKPADIQAARELFVQQLGMVQHPTPLYNIACCDALLGNPKSALEFLKKAVAAGYADAAHIESDSDLNSLRELPEFKEIVASLKSSSSSSSTGVEIPVTTAAPAPAPTAFSAPQPTPIYVPVVSSAPAPVPAPSPAPVPSVPAPIPVSAPAPEPENENMKLLESMGFHDRKRNAEVLARTNGNINVAISMLLNFNRPSPAAGNGNGNNWFQQWY